MRTLRGTILLVAAAALALLLIHPASAEVSPHALFADGAVLQQGMSVPIWGTADDGEEVVIRFQGQEASTTAKDGKWMVRLKPLRVGGPFTMTIRGSNTIRLKNILVGEVWVCSGQSNMAMALSRCANAEAAIAASADRDLRLFTVLQKQAGAPQSDVVGAWAECGPDTVANFSGVAYYFGRDLRRALQVPVGLIHSSVGGTAAEAWTSRRALEANPRLRDILTQPPGRRPGPTVLYNGMIAPLIPYAIRGAIWYQGESNAGRAFQYRTLFPELIRDWRRNWGQGDFPFLFVQLAPYMKVSDEPQDSAWAELREAQLLTRQTVPRSAMAVITDCGDPDDIHPQQKEPVGARLALAARAVAYGERIEHQGPLYKSMKVKGDRIYLSFSHVNGGLEARGGELTGLAVAGKDRKFVWAKATIEGDQVVVWSTHVPEPVAVRYGWANCPVVNLYNKVGLPASPFRTDDFPMVTGPQ